MSAQHQDRSGSASEIDALIAELEAMAARREAERIALATERKAREVQSTTS